MVVATQEVTATRPVKDLISGQLWSRLTKRIVAEHPEIDTAMAERILEQTLGFLQLCALSKNGGHAPSDMVDIGWHTFILYTREYAELCQRIAGRFIHHCPTDEVGIDYGEGSPAQTVAAMKACGISVDEELWHGLGDCQKDCNNCKDCKNCNNL